MEYFNVQLPSKGLPYGIAESDIQMTYVTGEIEESLFTLTQENLEEKAYAVLKLLIKGIDPKKLTLGDRMALLVQNTINSYTHFYPIDVRCNRCNALIKNLDVDLRQVDFNEINPDGFERNKVDRIAGKKVYLNLLTLEDEIAAEKYEADGGRFPILFRQACMVKIVKSIDDSGHEHFMDICEKVEFLRKLKSSEYNCIKTYGEKYSHGDYMNYKFQCPSCAQEVTTLIPFLFSLLLPSQSIINRYIQPKEEALSETDVVSFSRDTILDGEGVSDIEVYAGSINSDGTAPASDS